VGDPEIRTELASGNLMNKNQRIALLASVFVVVTMLIFPPWTGSAFPDGAKRSDTVPRVERFAGYYFILTPPMPADVNRFNSLFGQSISWGDADQLQRRAIEYRLDTARLYAQWACVVLVATGLILFFKTQ